MLFVAQNSLLFLLFKCKKGCKNKSNDFFSPVEQLKPVDVSGQPGRQAKHFIAITPLAGGRRKEELVFHFTLQLM